MPRLRHKLRHKNSNSRFLFPGPSTVTPELVDRPATYEIAASATVGPVPGKGAAAFEHDRPLNFVAAELPMLRGQRLLRYGVNRKEELGEVCSFHAGKRSKPKRARQGLPPQPAR